jgi:hypothetical protein
VTPIAADSFGFPFAACPAGKVAISGGIESTTGAIYLVESFAYENAGTFGWQFVVVNLNTTSPENVTVQAICISDSPGGLAAAAATTGPRRTSAKGLSEPSR